MNRPVLVSVLVVLVLALLPVGEGGWSASSVLMRGLGALAFVVGAWCAPATFRPPSGSMALPRGLQGTAWRPAKSLQLLLGGVAVVLAGAFGLGTAPIWGIVVALFLGAAPLGVKELGAKEPDGGR